MLLAIVPVRQIFGKYEQQARIAELNRKMPVKTIQNQADRVTISSEARKAQVLGIARALRETSKSLVTESKVGEGKSTSMETRPASDGNVESPSYESQGVKNFHAAADLKTKVLEAQDEARQKMGNVRKNVLDKSRGIQEKALEEATREKEEADQKEATPF